jgi:hypothetical protein
MKYIITLILLIVLISGISAHANEADSVIGWKKTLVLDFTTTQTGYSDSWVGGEAGSVNWVSNLNGTAEKQFSPRFNFKSTLKLSFGQTLTQDSETKDWSKPKKSTDLIDFENVGRYTMGSYFDPYLAFRIESQFYDARKDNMKLFFSPLKLTESIGFSRTIHKKDDDQLISRMGFGFRQFFKTEIDSTESAPGSGIYESFSEINSTQTDSGIESVTDATFKLHKNIQFTGKLTLFKALFSSNSDDLAGTEAEDYWKAVDVNWENIIAAQVAKLITVNLYTQLLYDKEVSVKGRLKETVAVGFVFKMF